MAIKKEIEINVKTDSAVKNVNNLNKEIKKTNEESKKTGEGVKDLANLSDGATGGMISKFGSLTGTLGKVSVAFRSVGAAIAASGIGLLVIVIASVISAFKSSEEGQNKFAKLMGVIGSVVGNVMDVISDLGEIIIGVLSGDSKAIKSATEFGKKIFDVVGLPIKNIIDIVKTAGAVLGSLFSGDVEGALNALDNGIKNVKGNFNEATDAINAAKNSLKQFGEEALAEAKIAQQIADNRAKADKTERNLIVQRAEGDRKIAELREKAVQRDTYNVSQRIAMLKEAQAIETNLTNQEIAAAKLRAEAKTAENALSKSTKEDLLEEENLKAKVIQLETSRLQGNRRLVSSIQSLQAEVRAEEKAAVEEKKKELEAEKKLKEEKIEKDIQDEKKRNDAIEALRKSYTQKIEDLEDTTELQKAERQQQRALLELEALNASEEQKLELLQYYSALKLNAQKTDNEKADAEAKKKAEEEIAIDKAVADAKLAIQNQALDAASNGINVLKSIFEKNKGIQKAALIAESAIGISKIVINTQAANAAAKLKYALLPGGAALAAAEIAFNKISAGIGIGANIASTAKALSALGGGGAPSRSGDLGASSGGGASATSAPQFNVVGNTGINQLAQTLGTQQPIEAFVVASNVTSAQSINRNIVQNASLG
jgi:hypothetical protein